MTQATPQPVTRVLVISIRGQDNRLVVQVGYRYGALYIKFVGTHAEYDAIDSQTV